MSTETAHSDDAFLYADAMACALAAVVLLLFTALVKIGAGKGTGDAYVLLTLEFTFDKAIRESGVSAQVFCRSDLFARVEGKTGRLIPERAAQGYRLSPGLLRKDRIVLETPPDQMPGVSFSVEPWSGYQADEGEHALLRYRWTTRLMIRWPAAPEALDWGWRFPPAGPSPRGVIARLSDHTCDRNHPFVEAHQETPANKQWSYVRVRIDEGSVSLDVSETQP